MDKASKTISAPAIVVGGFRIVYLPHVMRKLGFSRLRSGNEALAFHLPESARNHAAHILLKRHGGPELTPSHEEDVECAGLDGTGGPDVGKLSGATASPNLPGTRGHLQRTGGRARAAVGPRLAAYCDGTRHACASDRRRAEYREPGNADLYRLRGLLQEELRPARW